jgi:hypothetical protein
VGVLDQLIFLTLVLTLPSLKVPVAVICSVVPCCTCGLGGLTVSVVKVGFTKKPRQPAPKANIRRTVNAARSWSFRFLLRIIKAPDKGPHWGPPCSGREKIIVAESAARFVTRRDQLKDLDGGNVKNIDLGAHYLSSDSRRRLSLREY